jgi:hypothetical protein
MTKETITTKDNHAYTFERVNNDVNGNPRYIVHWLDLGLDTYEHTPETRKAGLSKYRAKSYGGGFVFSSYNLQNTANWFVSLNLYNHD